MKKLKNFIILFCCIVFLSSCSKYNSVIPSWISLDEWKELSKKQRVSAWEIQFIGYTNCYLAERGYRLNSGAGDDFKRFAKQAAEVIEYIPIEQLERRKKKVDEYEDNISLVIDTMIGVSKTIPGYNEKHYRVIGEQALLEALRKLCPVWPFCENPGD